MNKKIVFTGMVFILGLISLTNSSTDGILTHGVFD